MSVNECGQSSKMSSVTKTRLGQFLSRLTGSADARKSRRRRYGNGSVAEILEDRQLLAADLGDALASAWSHSVVGDNAAAFFDDSYVHDLYITFADENWYDTLYDSHANDADDPYFAADFTAHGVTIENVGVRFKGNSSFDGSDLKKSLKIDFDEFDEDNDAISFFGLKKLNLNNNFNDPTQLREKLILDYASNFVEGAGRAVHTNVYINGELWGLYTAVEQVDKTYVQTRFGNDEDGNLFKGSASDDVADDPSADFGSDLTYLGDDPDLYDDFYQLKTNETAYDYSQLIEFIDVLNNTAADDLAAAIEPLLDVQDTLAGLAINNLFSNLDSYNGAAHNYYLYDRDDTGQFTHILWDANESFGTFSQFTERGQDLTELDPFWVPVAMGPPGMVEAEERPLMESLWAVDEYSEDYLRDLAEILRSGFDVTTASTRINELADLIRDDVAADPNKQYTSAQFETNLTSDISDGMRTLYGLTSFIEDRSAFLDTQLDTYAAQTDLRLNELMAVNVSTVQDEAGDFDPWVEIYNFGPGLVDVSGLYLTDDPGNLTQWAIPASNVDDGEFLTLWLDGETSEGINHASFSLSSTGGELYLTNGTTVIDSVSYQALTDDLSLARLPDGEGEFATTDQPTFCETNTASAVVDVVLYINEIMADNDSTIEDPDEAGAFEDWIELYNPGSKSIDLTGFYLTDDSSDPTQWQFPAGSTIAAGGFLVIWADDDTDQGDTHASFKVSAGGEDVELYHIDGVTLVDSVTFGEQTTDVSYGRYTDGTDILLSMTTPTPGTTNVAVPQNVQIYINELMADNDSVIEDPDEAGVFEDWIELYNPGSAMIDLTGFYLTDDSSDPTQWQFPTGSTIAAGGFLVIWADNDTGQGDDHASFKLSSGGEVVELFNIDGTTLVDTVTFAEQATDISYGRYSDGTENFITMTTPTPGTSNVTASQGQVSIANASLVTEGEDLIFVVSIDQNPTSTVTVQVSTSDGTATAGGDYTAITSQTVTFQPGGSLTQSITVATINDVVQDSSALETVFVNLSSSAGATLLNNQAIGYIADDERLTKPTVDAVSSYPDDDSPTITWSDVDGAVGYQVWLTRVFPAASRVFTTESSVTGPAFTPSANLDPGYYRFWVQAVDSNGIGGTWSDGATFEIRPDLGTPTIASFTSPPTYTWTAIPNAPGYELYIRTSDGTNTIIDDITITSYTPTQALSQLEGRWWIRSSDAVGNRGWSLAGTFGIRTEVLSPSGTQITSLPTFNWVAVAGAGRHILHVTNLDTNTVVIREDQLTESSYTPSTALTAGNYRVWVKAIDGTSDLFSSGLWSVGLDFSITAADAPESSVIDGSFQLVLSSLRVQQVDSEEQNALPEPSEKVVAMGTVSDGQAVQADVPEALIQETSRRATDAMSVLDALMSNDALLAATLKS